MLLLLFFLYFILEKDSTERETESISNYSIQFLGESQGTSLTRLFCCPLALAVVGCPTGRNRM